jgi:hypothetical protein
VGEQKKLDSLPVEEVKLEPVLKETSSVPVPAVEFKAQEIHKSQFSHTPEQHFPKSEYELIMYKKHLTGFTH